MQSVYSMIIKRFAGHSKWANIRHVKAQKDAERGKTFTKLIQQMKVAIQEGSSANPDSNIKLSHIIEQSKRVNMPNSTIQNIIKGSQKDKQDSKIYLLTIKGPGSSIILCEAFTANLPALKMQISTILRKNNGKFSDSGVKYLFEQKGVIDAEETSKKGKEEILELAETSAIECEADDVQIIDELNILRFLCDPNQLNNVQNCLSKKNYKITSASIEYLPHNYVQLSDNEIEQCSNLIDKLESLEQIVKIYDNIA